MKSPLITTDGLEQRLGQPNLRILDCSVVMRTAADGTYAFVPGREEWAAGHVPGSVFVDVMNELRAQDSPLPMMMPPAAELGAALERYGVGDDTEVVLYDRSNHAWAARVWWMLRAIGFDAAAVLDGGWQKWQAEGKPVSTAAAPKHTAHLTLRARPEMLATKEQVRAALGRPDVTLINALSPAEYRGEAPTRFPRAGRIPGSTNVYCQSLIDPATHAYLPPERLRAIFAAAGALGAPRTITYCGAGIAASSDAFALTLLGEANVAVYDGSMAEWSADPSLPIERG